MELKCPVCRLQACRVEPGLKPFPVFCPMSQEKEALRMARVSYTNPDTRAIALAAAQTEAAGYGKDTRLQEVMGYARRLGVNRLGIAHCVGLTQEACLVQEILEANSFEVLGVCCKVGSIPKEEIGLGDEEKIRPGQYEALCNPIGQAMLLNEAGTGLNIALGLCVGHDSLFFQNSQAPVTVLVAKDRVTGHNPLAAIYTSHSYYNHLKGG